ncbi:DNA-processing protein DprA [Uliginosibacterium sp. H1]|uniref:DNA-processing protein DprA n=1 Tax=Uliginosibacterium sp. H1 TaxID=3114757 RepID=UPI002E18593F|nr:DNA-processing protein DprA [Uliginosibacterium sp. H1]
MSAECQRRLLAAFGLPAQVFASGRLALASVVGEEIADLLHRHDNRAEVDAALAWAAQPGNAVLTLIDPDYPQSLLQGADPPCLLYAKGRLELANRSAVAMVGARNATAQGERNAEAFAHALADAGLSVVSGLALGIDAAAHRGGLQGQGSTIAIIGTGADRIYPARNQKLARQIAEEGLVLSEFPLGTPPINYNFPKRNRIIAGLSRATLVVEAAIGSGSLITARLAGEMGREVMAIPGSIHSPLSKGCHQLIKQGAKLVESAQDVLEELNWAASPAPVRQAELLAPHADPAAARVLQSIGHDPIDPDTLLQQAGLTADALFAILTTLELDGRVARLPGGRFQRVD